MSDNPYAVRPQAPSPPEPELLPLARALMRNRLFALMHLSVAGLLVLTLGTIVRSGGASQDTALLLVLLCALTLGLIWAAVSALLGQPISQVLGAFADLLTLLTCILAFPALWSLALRFHPDLGRALRRAPPLSAWSPHWPTLILLPLGTAVNVALPLALAIYSMA